MKAGILILHPQSFIGSAVVRRLKATDWAEPVVAAPGGRLPVDHTDSRAVSAALRGCVGIVNCAMGHARLLDANTRALASALRDTQEDLHVVHISSMSVYGNATGFVSEDADLSAELGAYAAARIASETSLRSAYAGTVILRPGIEYGVGGWLWSGRIARLLQQRRLGDLGSGGDGYCNLVHVDDVAMAAESALCVAGARGGTFNLAMPDPPTWNEYLTRYALALGAVPVQRIGVRRQHLEAKWVAAPLKALEIVAGKIGVAPGQLPVSIPWSLWQLFRQRIRLDVHRAEGILDIRWRDVDVEMHELAARNA